jgi:cytochrome c5
MTSLNTQGIRNRKMRPAGAIVAVVFLLGTAACADKRRSPAAPAPEVMQHAQSMLPSDTRLAGLYRQSCWACHAMGAGGAPFTGDRATWDPRWDKGEEALRSSVIRGLNGMPAGGQCFVCSPADYDALIRFMAGR